MLRDGNPIVKHLNRYGAISMLVKIPTQPYSHPLLSPREQEIIRLVADGCPDKAIARTLGISPWTVNTHLRRIFTKLGKSAKTQHGFSATVGISAQASGQTT
jgi:DNA-binding CsgD family transcriptional regulator